MANSQVGRGQEELLSQGKKEYGDEKGQGHQSDTEGAGHVENEVTSHKAARELINMG